VEVKSLDRTRARVARVSRDGELDRRERDTHAIDVDAIDAVELSAWRFEVNPGLRALGRRWAERAGDDPALRANRSHRHRDHDLDAGEDQLVSKIFSISA
jgi:hypothetical protein